MEDKIKFSDLPLSFQDEINEYRVANNKKEYAPEFYITFDKALGIWLKWNGIMGYTYSVLNLVDSYKKKV